MNLRGRRGLQKLEVTRRGGNDVYTVLIYEILNIYNF